MTQSNQSNNSDQKEKETKLLHEDNPQQTRSQFRFRKYFEEGFSAPGNHRSQFLPGVFKNWGCETGITASTQHDFLSFVDSPEKYPSRVIEMGDGISICTVLIAGGDVPLPFPTAVLRECGLAKMDRFRWTPTEDGSITRSNIEKIQKRDRPSPGTPKIPIDEILRRGK